MIWICVSVCKNLLRTAQAIYAFLYLSPGIRGSSTVCSKITYKQAQRGGSDCGSVLHLDEFLCPFGRTSGFGSDGKQKAAYRLLLGGLSVGTYYCFHFYAGQRTSETQKNDEEFWYRIMLYFQKLYILRGYLIDCQPAKQFLNLFNWFMKL